MKTKLVLLALLLAACGGGGDLSQDDVDAAVAEALAQQEADEEPDPEPEPEPEPEPDPEPVAASGTYGSDPVLDRLQDRCVDGDSDACDDLFWDSPIGSEYEAFAQDQRYGTGGGTTSDGGSNDGLDLSGSDELSELVYGLVWDGMDTAERQEFCSGYSLFGPEVSHELFADGYGAGAPSAASFEAYFDGRC